MKDGPSARLAVVATATAVPPPGQAEEWSHVTVTRVPTEAEARPPRSTPPGWT